MFLREVRDFKRKWRRRLACPPMGGLTITLMEQRDMFEDAARIYFELVCPETSRCTVNLEYRITAALKDIFKDVTYDPKTQTAVIGAGNIWDDVYKFLNPQGVNVLGGRVSGIGVAGFTLGGGMYMCMCSCPYSNDSHL